VTGNLPGGQDCRSTSQSVPAAYCSAAHFKPRSTADSVVQQSAKLCFIRLSRCKRLEANYTLTGFSLSYGTGLLVIDSELQKPKYIVCVSDYCVCLETGLPVGGVHGPLAGSNSVFQTHCNYKSADITRTVYTNCLRAVTMTKKTLQ
jgi:hypothetical protein